MIDLFSVRKKYKVYIPSELIADKYVGVIYGYHHENTGVFNITGINSVNGEEIIGNITSDKVNNTTDGLVGYCEDGRL